jgi:hypothetical protein
MGRHVPRAFEGWRRCRDEEHGFSLRYPPDWRSTTPEGRCVQLQKGATRQPGGVPEGDIFIRVIPLPRGSWGNESIRTGFPQEVEGVDQGIAYADRESVEIAHLPAVRASFCTAGPTPNWGVEYAIRKDKALLDIYISQPSPAILSEFEAIVRTLEW